MVGEADAPWVVRPFVDDDENCIVSTWLKSYARSGDVRSWLEDRKVASDTRRWFTRNASDAEREQERYYWRFFQPLVTGLVRGAETRVLCDPSRVHSTPGSPSCIWAWACVSPGLVHYVLVKQEAIRSGADLAAEMVASLLSDRLDAPQTMTFEQRELQRLSLVPRDWHLDGQWPHFMRRLSVWVRRQPESMRVATAATLQNIARWNPGEAA